MTLRYLFVDMNSYFASVEQQDRPHLRGKPIAVVPVMANSTCCIAASYEAKAFGIRTGTPVWEALALCPNLHLEMARHERYVDVHEKIVRAVGRCIPVTEVMSIDEMKCKLLGREQDREAAVGIAQRVKAAIKRDAGEWMKCSIGIGPNAMLAKVASKRVKPDGLTVLPKDDLTDQLGRLELTDFPGIGPRLEKRFHRRGITRAAQLLALSPAAMCALWGSRVHGWRWWYLLRGYDVPAKPTIRRTVGHSHVLPPELRTDAGAKRVLMRMIHKATARLRKMNYWAGAVTVAVNFVGQPNAGWGRAGWSDATKVPHCQDTLAVLYAAAELWDRKPTGQPLKVGVVLTDLRPARSATLSLFEIDHRLTDLSHVMDRVNRAFGPNAVYFAGMFGNEDSAPMRIAFTHIPDAETESTNVPRRYGWG